jgi:hypothetical protein
MVHSGYEASAVDHTLASAGGLFATIKGMLFSKHPNKAALEALDEPDNVPHGKTISLTISASRAPAEARETAKV